MAKENFTQNLTRETARIKRAFLAHMRHELKTPLNAIIGYSEMLIEDSAEIGRSGYRQDLEKIHTAGQRLLSQVSDFFDQAKLETLLQEMDPDALGEKIQRDFRVPLKIVIDQCAKLIETVTDRGPEEFLSDLDHIQTAANKLTSLIDDIVSLPQFEAGNLKPDLEALGVPLTVRDAVKTTSLPDAVRLLRTMNGNILIVDDNETNRDVLTRRLNRLGHQVSAAGNGQQTLEMLRAKPYDLVLLDVMMPAPNGYQVLKEIKSDENLRDIPVIMISALDDIRNIGRCIELGAEDYLPKPFDLQILKARVGACLEKKRLREQEVKYLRELRQLNEDLEIRNKFIRKTFGRYLSDEIVTTFLETPDGLKMGGETRNVTILMADLRGFSSLAEKLSPEQVVKLLNIFLGEMAEVIMEYEGLIDEFIGDAILAIFGAPLQRANDAARAVACAVSMQLAMNEVNDQFQRVGLPKVAMGIGINTGEVIAGNIGSFKRTKYGVVGNHVNLTARIESYTVGGQILISEETKKGCGDILRIDQQLSVTPKGVSAPMTIHEVGGIGGEYNIFLPKKNKALADLPQALPFKYLVMDGKHAGSEYHPGYFIKLSESHAEVVLDRKVASLDNLKLHLFDRDGREIPGDVYVKVNEKSGNSATSYFIIFTLLPDEPARFIGKVLEA